MNKIIIILLVFVSSLVFGQGATPNLRAGLVGYWKFEEPSGTIAIDQKEYNDLTTNATVNQTGKLGKAYDYNGTNDYTYLPSAATLFADEDLWSVSMWFNAGTISSSSIANRMFGIAEVASVSLSAIIFAVGLTNKVQFYYKDSGGSGHTTDLATISASTWYHYVVTYDGTTYKAYINNSVTNITDDIVAFNSAQNVKIGTSVGAGTSWYDGLIDDVMIYDRALSALEVKQLYNSDSGLLYVQENFKNNYNYETLISYFIERDYFTWITGAKY